MQSLIDHSPGWSSARRGAFADRCSRCCFIVERASRGSRVTLICFWRDASCPARNIARSEPAPRTFAQTFAVLRTIRRISGGLLSFSRISSYALTALCKDDDLRSKFGSLLANFCAYIVLKMKRENGAREHASSLPAWLPRRLRLRHAARQRGHQNAFAVAFVAQRTLEHHRHPGRDLTSGDHRCDTHFDLIVRAPLREAVPPAHSSARGGRGGSGV